MSKPKAVFYNRSLERALQILGTFAFETRELTLAELSNALNLSKSTVYRLASTLVQYGFLRYNEESKKYWLGLRLFELGSIVLASFSLSKTSSPHLDRLHSHLGKTVFLGVFQEDEVVYIDKRELSQPYQVLLRGRETSPTIFRHVWPTPYRLFARPGG